MEGLIVHQGEAVLGEGVVGVERMPGGEGHLETGVPDPGGVVVSCQPPPSLPSPGLDQLGEERGEQFTDQVSQILSVKCQFFRIIKAGNPLLANRNIKNLYFRDVNFLVNNTSQGFARVAIHEKNN